MRHGTWKVVNQGTKKLCGVAIVYMWNHYNTVIKSRLLETGEIE